MAIELDRDCGESFRIADALAGSARCPYCDEVVLVPA
jgi:hypothetical protein